MTPMYMLDTDICIYLINSRSSNVVDNIYRHRSEGICISSITLAELEYGAAKSQHYERNIIAIHKMLSIINVLPFDEDAASYYGDIRARLERIGQTIGPLDMLIAAHAKSQRLVLVSNNTKEFTRVDGLNLVNWL